MPQSVKREQLVDTALRLFYRDGFHATGIDKILAEAGVARMTLYKHFKSKDDLVLAALRRRDEQFRTWFERAVEQRGATPRARLVAIFDALDDWFAGRAFPGGEFHGCAFVNAPPNSPTPTSRRIGRRPSTSACCGTTQAAWPRPPAPTTPRHWPASSCCSPKAPP